MWAQKRIPVLESSLIIFALYCILGCASTKIEGITKPGIDLYSYDNVLIFCEFDNLKYRQQLETELQKQFSQNDIRAFKSIDLFPPLKEYSTAETNEIIAAHNAEIILEIKILSSSSNVGDSSSFMMPIGGFYFGGGSSEIKLTIDFEITMFDIKSKEIIFKGAATSEDENDDLSECIEGIFKSLAEEIVEKYFIEGSE